MYCIQIIPIRYIKKECIQGRAVCRLPTCEYLTLNLDSYMGGNLSFKKVSEIQTHIDGYLEFVGCHLLLLELDSRARHLQICIKPNSLFKY